MHTVRPGRRLPQSLIVNIANSGAVHLINLVPALLLPFVAATVAHPRAYGVWAFLFSISTFSVLNDFGTAYVIQTRSTDALSAKLIFVLTAVAAASPLLVFGSLWLVSVALGWPERGSSYDQMLVLFGFLALAKLHQQILGGAQLALRQHRARLIASSVGVIFAVVLGLMGLMISSSLRALTGALLVGTLTSIAISWAAIGARCGAARVSSAEKTFMRGRVVTNGLSSIVSQGDRTAVMLLGGPALLLPYDLAMRVVAAGKTLGIAATTGMAAEARALAGMGLLRRARMATQRLVVLLYVVGVLCVTGVVVLAAALGSALLPPTLLPLIIILGLGHALHVATAPLTSLAAGLGNTSVERSYLAVSVVAGVALLPLASMIDGVTSLAAAVACALALGSLTLLLRPTRVEHLA